MLSEASKANEVETSRTASRQCGRYRIPVAAKRSFWRDGESRIDKFTASEEPCKLRTHVPNLELDVLDKVWRVTT
jgi:hypothetical protein